MFIRAAIFALALLPFFAGTASAQNALTKEDVQKIVADYIANNGEAILNSVDSYQRQAIEARQGAALSKNADALFKDEKTPVMGNPDGDIVIVEFFDYNCGYCKKVAGDLLDVAKTDGKVKLVMKEFPILGPSSETAAKWALAADNQKKYAEFHNALMNHRGPVNDDVLTKIAKDTGVDAARVKADIEGTDILLHIERNRALAGEMGITGTPAFVIGDTILPGAISKEAMLSEIKKQREKKSKKN